MPSGYAKCRYELPIVSSGPRLPPYRALSTAQSHPWHSRLRTYVSGSRFLLAAAKAVDVDRQFFDLISLELSVQAAG